MRLLATVGALCAAVFSVSAANNAISVPAGQSTLDVTAGQDLTIDWTDPSSGTVTIKLQQDPISPDGGITLACKFETSLCYSTVYVAVFLVALVSCCVTDDVPFCCAV